MNPILRITDGATHIDLVKRRNQSGFHLKNWNPLVATAKAGGVWSDSPIAEGRQLVARKRGNVIETYTVVVQGQDEDALIREDQELKRLFEKAMAYWETNWQTQSVWIEARSPCETNTRYAVLYFGESPSLNNPYSQPFLQADGTAVMDDYPVIVERGQWQGTRPGVGIATQLSNPGRLATTSDQVFIANKRNSAALTHIYRYDASAGVYSANLVASTAFNLLPNPPETGDMIYFGVNSGATNDDPFCSLVFDLATAGANLTGVTWQYYNAAAGPPPAPWTALPYVQDNTNQAGQMGVGGIAFDTTGVRSVHWPQPADWVPFAVNGVTAMWVRAVVGIPGGGPVAPVQQNRPVYTVLWPYVEIAAGQLQGDIPALARWTIANTSDRLDLITGLSTTGQMSSRIVAGVRSISRGSNFTAYVNFTSQNPAGISAGIDDPLAETTFANSSFFPVGHCIRYQAASAPANPARRAYVQFANTIVNQYYGIYRAFLRSRLISAPIPDVSGYLTVVTGGSSAEYAEVWRGPTFTYDIGNVTLPIDCGQLQLGAAQLGDGDVLNQARIIVWLTSSSGVGAVDLIDLILIPVDEFAFEVGFNSTVDADEGGWYADYLRYYDADSISFPRMNPRSWLRSGSEFIIPLQTKANGPLALQANRTQRVWFLGQCYLDALAASWEMGHRLQLWHTPRYLAMRGDR